MDDPTADKVKVREKVPKERNRLIRRGGSTLGNRAHICAFFHNPDDEYRVLLPFIKDGFACGEKAFHTVDPQRRDEHLQRLALAGIDVTAIHRGGQFELRDWTDTHLRDGQFDQSRTLALFEKVRKDARQQGFPLVRFITHMEWALATAQGVDALLEYEAKANEAWLRQDGPVHPVICTYDLTRFGGEIVVDVMRTHPMIIIDGILQENPFFIPPDEFLRELRERRLAKVNKGAAIISIGTKTEQTVDEVKHLKACINDLASVTKTRRVLCRLNGAATRLGINRSTLQHLEEARSCPSWDFISTRALIRTASANELATASPLAPRRSHPSFDSRSYSPHFYFQSIQ
jgi:hypothetical protein